MSSGIKAEHLDRVDRIFEFMSRTFGDNFAYHEPRVLIHAFRTEPTTAKKIAAHMGDKPFSTVARWVNLMAREGWLEQRRDPEEARRTMVYITERGRKFVKDLVRVTLDGTNKK